MIRVLRSVPILAACSDALLLDVASFTREITLEPLRTLFREGDRGDALYIVRSGAVEIRKDGGVLAVLEAGSLFGEMALFEDAPRSADAVARSECALLEIAIPRFRDLLLAHPDEGMRVLFAGMAEMSRRLRATSRQRVTVFETGRIVGARAPVQRMCEQIVRRLMRDMPGADGGLVLLDNPLTGVRETACRVSITDAEAQAAVKASGDRTGHAAVRALCDGTMRMTPLRDGERTLGFLAIRKAVGLFFSLEEEIILATVGDQVGLGLMNAYLRQEEDARGRLARHRMHGRDARGR